MSFAKSKNDFSKKDMNFFSEFSSGASQQLSSSFPFFLLATVAILAITLIVWIVCGIQIMNKQNKINDIKKTMASAEYQQRLAAKDQSQSEVEDLRSYYYVLSTLDSRVAGKYAALAETLVTCKENLPDDVILTGYKDEDGIVVLDGQSITRESAMNYLHLLKEQNLFSFVQDKIAPFDPEDFDLNEETLMYANFGYTFHFECTLKGHFTLSYASFLDGSTPTPLTNLHTQSFSSGAEYKLEKIATYSQDGVDYKLVNVKINGTAVSADRLSEIIASDALVGKISSNTNIEFMYATETKDNGGES